MSNNVFYLSWAPFVVSSTPQETWIAKLRTAVNACFTHGSKQMSRKDGERQVQEYLNLTRFPDLLSLDYGPALRRVGQAIQWEMQKGIKLKDVPHIQLILAVLCWLSLRAQNKIFIPGKNEVFLSELNSCIQNALKHGWWKIEDTNFISYFRSLEISPLNHTLDKTRDGVDTNLGYIQTGT